jgi:hypothetical protein
MLRHIFSSLTFLSSPKRPNWLWGPPSRLFKGCRGAVPGVKRPGRDVDHLSPSSVEVKNEWSYISAPPYVPSWLGQGQSYTDRYDSTISRDFLNL